MKHASTAALAAAISLAFIAFSNRAEAVLHGTWSGIVGSVSPATGPITRSVSADVRTRQMTVRWHCSGVTLCAVTGNQVDLGPGGSPWGALLVPPPGAVTPAPYFAIMMNSDCVAYYGPTARVGVWINTSGAPFAWQCFVASQPQGIRPRPDLPPIRLGPINLPPELRNPTGDERPTPRNQLPPGTRPRP